MSDKNKENSSPKEKVSIIIRDKVSNGAKGSALPSIPKDQQPPKPSSDSTVPKGV